MYTVCKKEVTIVVTRGGDGCSGVLAYDSFVLHNLVLRCIIAQTQYVFTQSYIRAELMWTHN